VIGECKAPGRRPFPRAAGREIAAGAGGNFPVVAAHMAAGRDAPECARERGVAVCLSYEFRR